MRDFMARHALLVRCARHIRQVEGFKNARTYYLRSIVRPGPSARWARFAVDLFAGLGLGAPPSFFLRKQVRAYAVSGWTARESLRAAIGHYEEAARLLPADVLRAILGEAGVALGEVRGRKAVYTLTAAHSAEMFREGEITINLWAAGLGRPLAATTFLFTREADGRLAALIGGLQGPRGEVAKRAVITATRDVYGMRPKQIVFEVVLAIAAATGCAHVDAVSNDKHVVISRDRRIGRGRTQADYDSFWTERGGVAGGAAGYRFVLPTAPVAPGETAVAAGKARVRAALAVAAATLLGLRERASA